MLNATGVQSGPHWRFHPTIGKNKAKNGKKHVKKGYKSGNKRSIGVNRAKVTGGGAPRKSKPRKKLTKKNKEFLERIGLEVKQNGEN